jgi:hypothetical protein
MLETFSKPNFQPPPILRVVVIEWPLGARPRLPLLRSMEGGCTILGHESEAWVRESQRSRSEMEAGEE